MVLLQSHRLIWTHYNRTMVKLKSKFSDIQITVIDGQAVNLSGNDVVKESVAIGLKAKTRTTIKGATQAQLKKFYESGSPMALYLLEEVSDSAKKPNKDKEQKPEIGDISDLSGEEETDL